LLQAGKTTIKEASHSDPPKLELVHRVPRYPPNKIGSLCCPRARPRPRFKVQPLPPEANDNLRNQHEQTPWALRGTKKVERLYSLGNPRSSGLKRGRTGKRRRVDESKGIPNPPNSKTAFFLFLPRPIIVVVIVVVVFVVCLHFISPGE